MGGAEKNNRLSELLNMEQLQKLQDNLAKALDLAFITVDYRGRPVTEGSGFTGFCGCMGTHDSDSRLCSRCDAPAVLQGPMSGNVYIYRGHGALVEFAFRLLVDRAYIGSVMG